MKKREGHVRCGILTMYDCAGVGPLLYTLVPYSVSKRRRWRRCDTSKSPTDCMQRYTSTDPETEKKKRKKTDGCPVLLLVSTRTLLLLHLVHTHSFTSSKKHFFSFVYTTSPTTPHRIYTV